MSDGYAALYMNRIEVGNPCPCPYLTVLTYPLTPTLEYPLIL